MVQVHKLVNIVAFLMKLASLECRDSAFQRHQARQNPRNKKPFGDHILIRKIMIFLKNPVKFRIKSPFLKNSANKKKWG